MCCFCCGVLCCALCCHQQQALGVVRWAELYCCPGHFEPIETPRTKNLCSSLNSLPACPQLPCHTQSMINQAWSQCRSAASEGNPLSRGTLRARGVGHQSNGMHQVQLVGGTKMNWNLANVQVVQREDYTVAEGSTPDVSGAGCCPWDVKCGALY